MASPSSHSKNNLASGAADLIRNLDAALTNLDAATTAAAQDAARARRNARAAGEVARRYGGSRTAKRDKLSVEEGSSNGLLERKRERRVAARMAAEARQRREHPMSYSPRRISTPLSAGSRGGGRGLFLDGQPEETLPATVAVEMEQDDCTPRAVRAAKPMHATDASANENVVQSMPDGAEISRNENTANNVSLPPTVERKDTIYFECMDFHQVEDDEPKSHAQEDDNVMRDNNEQQRSGPTEQPTAMDESPQGAAVDENHDGAPPFNEHDHVHQNPQYNQQRQTPRQPHPSPKTHSMPLSPPRSQPTSTIRIEASHAEDVLTLSLELERVRSKLASTTSQLASATSHVSNLQSQNDHLNSELTRLTNDRASSPRQEQLVSSLQARLDKEQLRAKAAEEDAALALELAKDAQTAREECEMWLGRSLEEIDMWRGRCEGLERQLREERRSQTEEVDDEEEEPASNKTKSVRFKEDCPPSPVVSLDGGYDEHDAPSHRGVANEMAGNATTTSNATPPPPPPPVWFTPQSSASTVNDANHEHPSKTDVASGRAFLHRASASPSPYKDTGGLLSPHPRLQASELLKKSAETRRLLRERLTPGPGPLRKPPVATTSYSDPASGAPNNDDASSFASRQGAACKAIGLTIRESGARLKLIGKCNDLVPSPPPSGPVIEGVAQLESWVKEYCSSVEGTIFKQREKIEELLAFCDHLEKEVMLVREF